MSINEPDHIKNPQDYCECYDCEELMHIDETIECDRCKARICFSHSWHGLCANCKGDLT